MQTIHAAPGDKLSELVQTVRPHTRILLEKGVYREKIEITVPDIELVGQDAKDTVIVYSDYAKKMDSTGREYNTFRTYTAAVLAPRVSMKNLTVKNDSRFPEQKGQEVALTVYADEFSASQCRFLSTQDTVFCGPLPSDLIERYNGFLKDPLRAPGDQKQIFRDCLIAGTVDFIFGCADALFENCEIRSLYEIRGHGYTAAPAHALSQQIGFVFHRCRFTCEENVADGSVFLARPWRDYGKASFISCEYGKHIAETGFDKWNDTNRDKTARFSEYGTQNPGRVPWSKTLSENEKKILLDFFSEK